MTPNYKSIVEVEQYLYKHFSVIPLNFYVHAGKTFQKCVIANLRQFVIDHEVDIILPQDNIKINYYRIAKDNKSSKYYDCHGSYYQFDDNYFITVVMQPDTEYLECNNYLLARELLLLQGVSKQDIQNKTLRYLGYLALLNRI